MQGTHLKFTTKEDAIHFCEKQGAPRAPPRRLSGGCLHARLSTGYGFYVQEPHATKFKTKTYAKCVLAARIRTRQDPGPKLTYIPARSNYLYSDKALRIAHTK